jgi:hypothetical protein
LALDIRTSLAATLDVTTEQAMPHPLRYRVLLILAMLLTVCQPRGPSAQSKHYPLETTAGLRLHHATAQPITFQGKKGLRVTRQAATTDRSGIPDSLIAIEGLEFANGVIEGEIAGAPGAGAPEGARGFVGIAFRLREDMRTYDAFYLRPTNGRADDQVRRNHAAQYISHPDWPWHRLRKETPSKYEAYVDLVPDTWTKVKIQVNGERALLYVHDHVQPTLVVNDLKTGAQAKGAVALWLDVGTVAHFRNLTVTPAEGGGDR